MIENKVATWLLGYTMGCMTIMAAERLTDSWEREKEKTTMPPYPLAVIASYNKGRQDALKINPPSFELEETCLEIWANKQPVDSK